MVIVNFPLKIASWTSIIFMVLVLIAPLIPSPHIVSQGFSNLVSYLWVS